MPLSEFIAETILNKISQLVNKNIMIADNFGTVLASTELTQTHTIYTQLQQAAEKTQPTEITVKDTAAYVKDALPQGIAIPLVYNGETVGVIFINDEPSNYNKYSGLLKSTAELLIHQTMVIDNVPYKSRIKDNFIFGLLHRKISWNDPRTYDEADLLEVNLHKDKIVLVIAAHGFWQHQFESNTASSEDERQSKLQDYKKSLYEAVRNYFNTKEGIQVSYFGNDTFVLLVDEMQDMDGNKMVNMIRTKAADFNKAIRQVFGKDTQDLAIAIGNFYRGKDGIALAYEEAKIAMQLGSSVNEQRPVYHVDDLGMVAVLAGGNKRWQESFVKNLLTQLLSEKYLLETVDVFFDQNMSLTQTAKKLQIHRNTLLYRLSKVKKITGLDPRKFSDAIKIKMASLLYSLQDKVRV